MQARDPTASESIAGSAPPSRLAAVPVRPTGSALARLAATVGNRAFARAAAQGRLGAVQGRQAGGAGSQGRSGGRADGAGRVLARCACGRPARSGEACSDCARGSDGERDALHVLSESVQARRLVGRKPLEEDRVLSRDAAATTGSVGRPVYVCWSPTEAVPVANHSWFRLDDPAPDPQHETFSVFPVPSGKRKSDGATCTQGQTFAGADDKGGIARQGKCKLVGVSPSCISREFFRYPIGQYCPGGPNSNTFVGTIVSNCGGETSRIRGRHEICSTATGCRASRTPPPQVAHMGPISRALEPSASQHAGPRIAKVATTRSGRLLTRPPATPATRWRQPRHRSTRPRATETQAAGWGTPIAGAARLTTAARWTTPRRPAIAQHKLVAPNSREPSCRSAFGAAAAGREYRTDPRRSWLFVSRTESRQLMERRSSDRYEHRHCLRCPVRQITVHMTSSLEGSRAVTDRGDAGARPSGGRRRSVPPGHRRRAGAGSASPPEQGSLDRHGRTGSAFDNPRGNRGGGLLRAETGVLPTTASAVASASSPRALRRQRSPPLGVDLGRERSRDLLDDRERSFGGRGAVGRAGTRSLASHRPLRVPPVGQDSRDAFYRSAAQLRAGGRGPSPSRGTHGFVVARPHWTSRRRSSSRFGEWTCYGATFLNRAVAVSTNLRSSVRSFGGSTHLPVSKNAMYRSLPVDFVSMKVSPCSL